MAQRKPKSKKRYEMVRRALYFGIENGCIPYEYELKWVPINPDWINAPYERRIIHDGVLVDEGLSSFRFDEKFQYVPKYLIPEPPKPT